MNTLIRRTALGLALLLLAAGSASAGASVTFAQPERFSDFPRPEWEREPVLKSVSAHFDKLAKSLPAGQTLKVEILDIDLAGEVRPHRGTNDLRILRGGADWPKIQLRYSIEQDGKVVKSGDETLSNMNYLHRHNHYASGETLRYEKQMLDDWFKERIAGR